VLALLWALLYLLVSLIEFPAYLHDPSVPVWKPLTLAGVPTAALLTWLMADLRSRRYERVSLEPSRAWFGAQFRRLPPLMVVYLAVALSVHRALFAPHPGEDFAAHSRLIFEVIKTPLFYALWLGLVYGTLSLLDLRERNSQLAAARRALAETRLALLQSQLRPHFLFNTLNTVSSLMVTDVRRADRVLTGLADLLRASLGMDSHATVPLHEELRLLRMYAGIMEERFAGRVQMGWRIDEAALATPVPAMLLQPLLENAFKHGIEQTSTREFIDVAVTHEGDRLCLSVRNSGSRLGPNWQEGLGLGNCRERLRVLYGDAARVVMQNHGPAGVEAAIALPWSAPAAAEAAAT
jgi:LytS/YehU family sensor histidine kinase